MSKAEIFGNRSVATKTALTAALGESLLKIKCTDHLTLEDMAVTLGKGDDMVALYIAGETEMGVFAYHRARAAWGNRFTNLADRLFGDAA